MNSEKVENLTTTATALFEEKMTSLERKLQARHAIEVAGGEE
jgi:hypothetical protein